MSLRGFQPVRSSWLKSVPSLNGLSIGALSLFTLFHSSLSVGRYSLRLRSSFHTLTVSLAPCYSVRWRVHRRAFIGGRAYCPQCFADLFALFRFAPPFQRFSLRLTLTAPTLRRASCAFSVSGTGCISPPPPVNSLHYHFAH